MAVRMRVLLVQDDKPSLRAITRALKRNGVGVDTAEDGDDASSKLKNHSPYDAVIVDLTCSAIGTLALVESWRAEGVHANILVLSSQDGTAEKILAFNSGADAYLAKPCQLEELLAQIRALARRNSCGDDPVLRVADLEIDSSSRTVKRAGDVIELTHREYELLLFLASHKGKVVTRTMIRAHLYKHIDNDTSNVVDVYISYLRKKIDQGYDKPLIRTHWGHGYMMRDDGEET